MLIKHIQATYHGHIVADFQPNNLADIKKFESKQNLLIKPVKINFFSNYAPSKETCRTVTEFINTINQNIQKFENEYNELGKLGNLLVKNKGFTFSHRMYNSITFKSTHSEMSNSVLYLRKAEDDTYSVDVNFNNNEYDDVEFYFTVDNLKKESLDSLFTKVDDLFEDFTKRITKIQEIRKNEKLCNNK